MKTQAIIAALATLAIASCTKQNVYPGARNKDGKDDDDGPIIIEIAKNTSLQPLAGCQVFFAAGGDSLKGTTDNNGSYQTRLPRPGDWYCVLSYGSVQTGRWITVTDSVTVNIDVLPVE